MYASVRSYDDPSLAGALAARADEIRAVIGEVPGLRAYYLVQGSEKTVTVTVCDDQVGAEESNRVAAQWLRDNMPELGSGVVPTVHAGSVLLDV